jgi:putative Mg2+ transporter-C (MgtC) family protein
MSFSSLAQALGYDPAESLHTLGLLLLAFLFGGMIGLERQFRQRSAGLRTMVLVVVGATAFIHLGMRLAKLDGELKILPNIVSGIGFLGAGVIMKEGQHVKGLNTAATLWSSAAVGAFLGCGLIVEAFGLTVFILAGNTLLRPLVNYLDRLPLAAGSEACYTFHVICKPEDTNVVRDVVSAVLEKAKYPHSKIDLVTKADGTVELDALLSPHSAKAKDLDAICATLGGHAEVLSATWLASASGG